MADGAINCADADVLASLRKIVGESNCASTARWVAEDLAISTSAAAASLRRLVAAGRVERDRKHRGTYYRPVEPVEDGTGGTR